MSSTKSSTKPKPPSAVEGEGNYTAARRHRESAEAFVESGQVSAKAREAQPHSTEEAKELKAAEQKGLAKAKH